MGKRVAWSSVRTPAGPSARAIAGIPRRGMAYVVPAAPFTGFSAWHPVPSTKCTFSFKVIAPITSSSEASPNWGASLHAATITAAIARMNNFFI